MIKCCQFLCARIRRRVSSSKVSFPCPSDLGNGYSFATFPLPALVSPSTSRASCAVTCGAKPPFPAAGWDLISSGIWFFRRLRVNEKTQTPFKRR